MITGNSRWPLFRLNESAANAQSWAITITPKMLTQMKNGNAIWSPATAAAQNSSRFEAKKAVTARRSRSPSSRRRTAAYMGTSSMRMSAISATA
jgi:hypothetical protein